MSQKLHLVMWLSWRASLPARGYTPFSHGLACEDCRPSNPPKTKKLGCTPGVKVMRRSAWLKLRVTPVEKENISVKATAQGQTVTDFIRQRVLDYRLRKTHLDREYIRELARIGNNLNQIAKWANTYKDIIETVDMLAVLVSLEREIHASIKRGQK